MKKLSTSILPVICVLMQLAGLPCGRADNTTYSVVVTKIVVVTNIVVITNAAVTTDTNAVWNEEEDGRNKDAGKIGDKMDHAEKYLEEYGSISISIPLMSKLNENFNFDLSRGTTNYFNDAKNQVQGAAAAFQQTVQSLSVSAQGQFDPTVAASYAAQLGSYFSSLQRYNTKQSLMDQAAQEQLQAGMAIANTNADPAARYAATAQALQAYEQAYSAPSNAPAFPTDAASSNLPAAGALPGRPGVTNVLSAQQFLPFQGLLAGLNLQPTVSDRTALMQAAGDVATESIFRHFMGSTNTSAETAEDNVFFGFSTVSVNPGWRTKQGWVAEAIMTSEIGYTKARSSIVSKVFDAETDPVVKAQLYLTYGTVFTNRDAAATLALKIAQDYKADKNHLEFMEFAKGYQYKSTNTVPATNWTITVVTTNYAMAGAAPDAARIKSTSAQTAPILTLRTNTFDTTNIEEFYSNAEARYEHWNSTNIPPTNLSDLDSNVDRFIGLLKTNLSTVYTNSSPNQTNDFSSASNAVLTITSCQYVTNYILWTNTLITTNSLPPQFSMADKVPNPMPVPVTIISPLVDADVEDFSSSSRSQTEFALALSFALRYAGFGGQASAFEQFVKNNQFDIRTRNAMVAVNAFSGTDGKFGFQVGPRLQALDNPAQKTAKSGQLLDRQSFPALLILRLGQVDLGPFLRSVGTTGILQVMEPQLQFTQMRRWTPTSHTYARDGLFFRWYRPIYWDNPPVSEKLRLQVATGLNSARRMLSNPRDNDLFSLSASNAIAKRIDNLESQIVGAEGGTVLDANDVMPVKTTTPQFASITNTVPEEIVLDERSTNISIAFIGTGLNQIETKSPFKNVEVTAIPQIPEAPVFPTNTFALQALGQMLVFSAGVSNTTSLFPSNNFALVFKVQTTNSPTQFVYSKPVKLRLAGRLMATNMPTVSFTVSNNVVNNGANGSGNLINYTLAISTNVTESQLTSARELIKADIEKNKPESSQSSNTIFSVLVNENTPGTGATNRQAPPRKAAVKLER